MSVEQVIEQLKADYERFPKNQTYGLYADNVTFKDPLNSFSGVKKYREMIGFLSRFFRDIEMELHSIEKAQPDLVATEWTLNMTPPVPWASQLSIPGRSELKLNAQQLIESHVDYWHCSRLAVLKQVFSNKSRGKS